MLCRQMLLSLSLPLSVCLSLSLSVVSRGRGGGAELSAAAAAVLSALCSLCSGKKAADGLSPSVTLAQQLTVKTATERSHEKLQTPVKVAPGLLWDFNVRKYKPEELRGSCRRPQRELSSRISTWGRLAQGLARLQTIFNWLWAQWLSLVSPCHSDSFGKLKRGEAPVNFMTNQSSVLKLNFGRRDWERRSKNEEAVQPDETTRQSNSWQASIEVSSWSKVTLFCFF